MTVESTLSNIEQCGTLLLRNVERCCPMCIHIVQLNSPKVPNKPEYMWHYNVTKATAVALLNSFHMRPYCSIMPHNALYLQFRLFPYGAAWCRTVTHSYKVTCRLCMSPTRHGTNDCHTLSIIVRSQRWSLQWSNTE